MREGIAIKKIGDVCEVIPGQSPKSKFYNDEGEGLPFYQGKKRFTEKFIDAPVKWTTNITKEAVDGDILMSVRAPVGPVNFATQKICIGRGLAAIRPKEKLDRDYLFYFFLKNEADLESTSGAVFDSINSKQIRDIKIPIPPLPEQKRIVAILDEAFEAIDQAKANIERNIENAEELFQSKLNEIFSKRAEGWEEKPLKEACEIRPSKRQVKKKMSDDELVSFVPMSHLEINKKYFEEESTKPLGEVYKGYTYFEDGDVLLAKITPCFENGKLGIASSLENGVGFGSSEYIVYRPHKGLLNEYLYYFLNRDRFRSIGESLMGGAVGHQRIQKEFYEDFKITYPDVSKQKEIVQLLDAISFDKNEMLSIYKRKLSALEELKKSILQKAFSGELTTNEHLAA